MQVIKRLVQGNRLSSHSGQSSLLRVVPVVVGGGNHHLVARPLVRRRFEQQLPISFVSVAPPVSVMGSWFVNGSAAVPQTNFPPIWTITKPARAVRSCAAQTSSQAMVSEATSMFWSNTIRFPAGILTAVPASGGVPSHALGSDQFCAKQAPAIHQRPSATRHPIRVASSLLRET